MALLSAKQRVSTLAPALPVNWRVFDEVGLRLRRGQMSVLSGAPGVGKSLVARSLVTNCKTPSLYFSADSDEWTVKTTVAASLAGLPLEQMDDYFNDEGWSDFIDDKLHAVDHVEWCFRPSIDVELIEEMLKAYTEPHGAFPTLVIIDNLGDMVTEDGDEYGELRTITREIHRMGRYTNAHFLCLAHLKGEWEDGLKPVTLRGLLGNLGKTPEQVLGLNWTDATGKNVQMTVPKARGSKRGLSVPVSIDYETAFVGGYY